MLPFAQVSNDSEWQALIGTAVVYLKGTPMSTLQEAEKLLSTMTRGEKRNCFNGWRVKLEKATRA